MANEYEKPRELIRSGSDLAGAAVGSALGFFAAGPGAAAVSGAVGVVVTRCLTSIAERFMSGRERIRVGSVAAFALSRINERIKSGHIPRGDSFFLERSGVRPDGEQLLEGVLLKARDEYEEKKLKYMGNFFANLAFTDSVSVHTASLLLKQTERLTYRQMCLLALINEEGSFNFECLRRQDHSNPELEALKREEMDLHSSDLGVFGFVHGLGPWDDELSTLGRALADLAQLDQIPATDRNEIIVLLAKCPAL